MRKYLISAAVAASTIAVASPAAAQYYPQQGYGYNANYGQARNLVVRVDQIRRQIEILDSRDRITEREARNLRQQAAVLRNRVARASYNGLSYREQRDIQVRIANLEQRVRRDVVDGNRYGYRNTGYYSNVAYDRDRDGLDDRYERDRGTNFDEDRDAD
jgi:hypothetical protein